MTILHIWKNQTKTQKTGQTSIHNKQKGEAFLEQDCVLSPGIINTNKNVNHVTLKTHRDTDSSSNKGQDMVGNMGNP